MERQVASLREALKGSDLDAGEVRHGGARGTLSRVGTAAYQAAQPMDGPGMPGSDGTGEGGAPGDGQGEGEPAGAGARSGGADGATADDAVEGEYKEV